MARHSGFGHQSVGGAPQVSAATATLMLVTFFAAIWSFAHAPKSAVKLFLLAGAFTLFFLIFGIDNVLTNPWACWAVLIGGWWLSDHLRKEQDARKKRVTSQEGVRK